MLNKEIESKFILLLSSRVFLNSQIAKDLGVNYQTFGNWMRKAMSSQQSNPKKVAANKQDYKALERELKAARKELKLRKKEIA